jgi:hypothetical protein
MAPHSKSSYPTRPSFTEHVPALPRSGNSSTCRGTAAIATALLVLFRARVPAPRPRRRASSAGSGTSAAALTQATRTAARLPRCLCAAGSQHHCGTSIGRAHARVLGPRSAGLVVRWVRGGGPPATSAVGTAVGAAPNRIARPCARAAPGQGRLPVPAPVPGRDLAPSLIPVPVLVHALAQYPRHILRGLGAVVGLGLIAAVVEATAGMISGIAGPAHQPRRMYDKSKSSSGSRAATLRDVL